MTNKLEYKTRKFLMFSYRTKDGWRDLGKVGSSDFDFYSITYEVHVFCHTRARVGKRDNGELFKYCPKCKVITK